MQNHGLPFANVDQAHQGLGMQQTRYDLLYPGMQDNTNPAILVIDSTDRDNNRHPNSNQYTIKLSPVYKQVTCIELVTADIPNSGYVIESSHNVLHFQETTAQFTNNTYLTAVVPAGNRTIENICSVLETKMNQASQTGATYSCSVDTITNRVTITQTSTGTSELFNLIFEGISVRADPPHHRLNGQYTGSREVLYKERSIGPVIGFKRQNLTDATSYTGGYNYNLKVDKYISMFINKAQGTFARVDSKNDNVKGAFSVIPLDSSVNNFQYAKDFSTCDNDKYVVYFPQPLPELDEMTIEFRDSFGNLFNFNGHDHMLTFKIHSNTRLNQFKEQH